MDMQQDFKYVIQDFSNVYLGGYLTFAELVEFEDTPQRLKSAIFRYLYEDGKKDMRLCEALMQMEPQSPSQMIFQQLKCTIRIVTPVTKTDRKGNTYTEYKTQGYSITDFLQKVRTSGTINENQISEVNFKKLNLMSLAV